MTDESSKGEYLIMKGIITKDLLGLKQVGLTMGLLMLFYLFLGFMSGNDSGGGMSYFSIMALVINVMVPLSCAGYDEQCDWDSFGASLPVSKNKIVICRYIVNLMVMCFTTFVVFVANMLFAAFGGSTAGVLSYVIPVIVSVYYIAIMTPIIYKFGVQKSRFIVIAIMIVPSMLIAGLGVFMANHAEGESSMFLDSIDAISSVPVIPVAIGATVIAAVVYALSMLLSMRIYCKKEL